MLINPINSCLSKCTNLFIFVSNKCISYFLNKCISHVYIDHKIKHLDYNTTHMRKWVFLWLEMGGDLTEMPLWLRWMEISKKRFRKAAKNNNFFVKLRNLNIWPQASNQRHHNISTVALMTTDPMLHIIKKITVHKQKLTAVEAHLWTEQHIAENKRKKEEEINFFSLKPSV